MSGNNVWWKVTFISPEGGSLTAHVEAEHAGKAMIAATEYADNIGVEWGGVKIEESEDPSGQVYDYVEEDGDIRVDPPPVSGVAAVAAGAILVMLACFVMVVAAILLLRVAW